MQINISALGMELTSAMRSYAEKRLASLEKKMGDHAREARGTLELKKTTRHHQKGEHFRAELRIAWEKEKMVVAPEAEDLYAAIDLMKEEAAEEIAERRDRKIVRERKGGREIKKILQTAE